MVNERIQVSHINITYSVGQVKFPMELIQIDKINEIKYITELFVSVSSQTTTLLVEY